MESLENAIEVRHLRKVFGTLKAVDGIEFELKQGDFLTVFGPNGAGKTTLFRMLNGSEEIDAGEIRLGESVQIASVDQSRDSLDDSKTIWEEISDGQDIITVGKYETPSRAYVGRFNFRGSDQQKKIGLLSGGERRRVEIARTLSIEPKFILLDEPFAGVDPISVLDIQGIIKSLASDGIGILITDHNVRETLGICDRGYIVSEGTSIAYGTPDQILENKQVKKVYLGESFKM